MKDERPDAREKLSLFSTVSQLLFCGNAGIDVTIEILLRITTVT